MDVTDIKPDSTFGAFGPRGSGKTTAMLSILAHMNLPRGIAMCPTPESFVSYARCVPLGYIYNTFDEEALERILKFQNAMRYRLTQIHTAEMAEIALKEQEERTRNWEERVRKLHDRAVARNWSKKQMEIAYERAILDEEQEEREKEEARSARSFKREQELRAPWMLYVLLDDLSYSKAAMRSELLSKLCRNGRHFMLALFISVQFLTDLPPGCRGCLDWVAVFYDTLTPNLKKLWENVVGTFSEFHEFEAALKEACAQKACLVIRKNVPTSRPQDVVFFYQAKRSHAQRYFGDEASEWVSRMFVDKDRFEEVVMAVRDPGDEGPGKKKAAGRTSARKKAAAEQAEAADEEKRRAARTSARKKTAAALAGTHHSTAHDSADGVAADQNGDQTARKALAREPVKTTRSKAGGGTANDDVDVEPDRTFEIEDDGADTDDEQKKAKLEKTKQLKASVASLRERMKRLTQQARAAADAKQAANNNTNDTAPHP